MKILLFLSLMAVFASCDRLASPKAFANGVFVLHNKTDTNEVHDTIIVRSTVGNGFLIERNMLIQGIGAKNSKRISEKWSGLYDTENKLIVIPRSGKIIFIDPGSRRLLIGSKFYSKIAN